MRCGAGPLLSVSVELVPARALDALLREIAGFLPEEFPTEMIAGSKAYPFHMTLLYTVVAADLGPQIGEMAAQVARHHHPFSVALGGYRLFSDGSLALLADKCREIRELHEDIVKLTRSLPRVPRRVVRADFTKAELERFMEVGDPYALECFVPHVTLARFTKSVRITDITPRLPAVSRQFRFSGLRVRAWSDAKSAARTIRRCSLGRP